MQVFTGYLDTTPYLQLFPGTCSLKASCTLKRLQYTYWDPGIQFTREFLTKYNWLPNPQTGTINNPSALKSDKNKDGAGPGTPAELTDGGIATLLYAVMHDIGKWDNGELVIESMPKSVMQSAQDIFNNLATDDEALQKEVESFLSDLIGQYSSGGGGMTSGGGSVTMRGNTNAEKIFNYFVDRGLSTTAAAAFVGNFQLESGCDPSSDQPDGEGRGIAQWGEGARWDSCVAFANSQGKQPDDLDLQLDFVWKELNESYTGVLSTVKSSNNLEECVTIICTDYEAPLVNNISERLAAAQDALDSFGANAAEPQAPHNAR